MGFLTPKTIIAISWCGRHDCTEASITILALIFLLVVAHIMHQKWEKQSPNE